MKASIVRIVIACSLLLLVAATALAEPIPAPRALAVELLKNGEFINSLNHWALTGANAQDKVKCNGVGYNSDCGFRFKGTSPSEATTLQQVFVPAPTTSTTAVVIFGEAYTRSLSGTSCLKFTVKLTFKNPNADPLKDSYTDCGTGALGIWSSTHQIGEPTSFTQKSLKKAVFTIRHTGVGEWMVDAITLTMSDK